MLTSDSPQLFTLSAVSYLLYYFTGAKKLVEKIKEYNPKIAVFNGKGIYEVFSGEKEFIFGKQPQKIADTDTVQQLLFKLYYETIFKNKSKNDI